MVKTSGALIHSTSEVNQSLARLGFNRCYILRVDSVCQTPPSVGHQNDPCKLLNLSGSSRKTTLAAWMRYS